MSMVLEELPFDQYQRYKAVQDLVTLVRDRGKLKVLDVGGHPGFIMDFLPHDETYVLDNVPGQAANNIQGSGLALPFSDGTFDVVISIDTLEHIESPQRAAFLGELLRVSRNYLLLAGPFESQDVVLAEQIVYHFLKKRFAFDHSFLREHLAYGLPRLNEVLSYLDERGIQHVEVPSGYLYNWLFMMVISPFLSSLPNSDDLRARVNALYNTNFYASDRRPPAYRTVVLASRNHSMDSHRIEQKYDVPAAEVSDQALKLALVNLLLQLDQTHQLQQTIGELEERLAAVTTERDQYHRQRDVFEANLVRYHRTPPFRLYFRLKTLAQELVGW